MKILLAIVAVLVLACGTGQAQQPAPAGMSLADAAAKRFPQPITVGALVGRNVLRPVESQPRLGRVDRLVKSSDGRIDVVVEYGGVLGLFSRPIAVPLDAMVLLGPYMEIVDLAPEQLDRLATFDGAGAVTLPAGDMVRVGLARPSH